MIFKKLKEYSLEVVITRIVCLGLFSTFLLSLPLWTTSRKFPIYPIFDKLGNIPENLNIFILGIALICLFSGMIYQKNKKYVKIALPLYFIILFFWVMQDFSRFVITIYMLSWTLAPLTLSLYANSEIKKEGYLNNVRAIVIATYIWGGLNKFNLYFFGSVFPWFVEPIIKDLTAYTLGVIFAALVPFIEASIGVLSIFPKTRKYAILLSLCMLVTVLASLGPFGHNWAMVVWPWNVVLFSIEFLLFFNSKETSAKEILNPKRNFLKLPIISLLFFAPILWYFGLWQTNASFHMYTGVVTEGHIDFIDPSLEDKLPPNIKQYAIGNSINMQLWTNDVYHLNTPQETNFYKNAAKYICMYTGKTGDVRLRIVLPPKTPLTAKREELISKPCEN